MYVICQYFRVKRDKEETDFKIKTERQKEYTHCLKKNLECRAVNQVHILYERQEDLDELVSEKISLTHPKLVLHHLGRQMLYSDAFQYCNDHLKDEVCTVLHTDIYIESGFEKLTPEVLRETICPLARSNNVDGRNTGRGIRTFDIDGKKYCATIDGWCFLSPVKEEIIQNSRHAQNIWGSENRIIWLFKNYGYRVFTPNWTKMVHWHKTDIRPGQNNNWIMKDGTLIPHCEEINVLRKKMGNVVGGLIPLREGVSEFLDI